MMTEFNYIEATPLEGLTAPAPTNRVLQKDISRQASIPIELLKSTKQTGVLAINYVSNDGGPPQEDFVEVDGGRPKLFWVWHIGTKDSEGIVALDNLMQLPDFNQGSYNSSTTAVDRALVAKLYDNAYAYCRMDMYDDGQERGSRLIVSILHPASANPQVTYTAYFRYLILNDDLELPVYGLGQATPVGY